MGQRQQWGMGAIRVGIQAIANAAGSLMLLGLVGWSQGAQMEPAFANPFAGTFRPQPVQPQPSLIAQQSQAVNPKLVSANTRFGLKLFSEILKRDSNKNVFVSPSSVAIALSMAYNGANGETQQAMARALNVQGMSLEELNRGNADLRELLQNPDPKVQLAIANSLWARQGVPFKPEFIQRNQQFYGAKVAELDFADSQAASIINNWVNQNTRGKISKIIDTINPNDVMFLINAIYFKGNWSNQFDKQQTSQKPFYLLGGSQKQHPMMNQQGEYRYYEDAQIQAVSLPYGERRRMSMYIVLPKKPSNLSDFYTNLTAETWESLISRLSTRQGTIQIPKFKLEYSIELKQALSALGMAAAFGDRADFSNLSQAPTKIDEVKHKTFVEVNEEGTEAAAVTSIGIRATSIRIPEEPFRMVVDRPFFCAIRDNQTGAVLFMGSIVDPKV
ncbi:MAG: serpin family protein [Leptolyngbyaceae cyanobacterium RU_5_1]|nr:serpin family protein [Leptolyngbyaceae cyanobacterium RU_5_1]